MPVFNVTGDDTLVINGNVFTDLGTDDVTTIELPNDLVNIKTGKNKNGLLSLNNQGFLGNMVLKVVRGSSDDQFLNNILGQMEADFVSTQLLAGTFSKRMGDGNGNVIFDNYTLQAGVISKIPGAKDSASGDVAQGEVTYNIKWTNVTRGIE